MITGDGNKVERKKKKEERKREKKVHLNLITSFFKEASSSRSLSSLLLLFLIRRQVSVLYIYICIHLCDKFRFTEIKSLENERRFGRFDSFKE